MISISLGHACHDIAQAALVLLLQSSLILLLGLGLGRLLRRYGPQARSLAYRTTLVAVTFAGLASLPFSPSVRPLCRIALPDATEIVVQPSALPESVQSEEPSPPPAVHNDSVSPTTPTSVIVPTDNHVLPSPVTREAAPALSALPLTGDLFAAAVSVWFLGFIGLLSWLFLGQLFLVRLRRRSASVTTGTAADLLRRLCSAHPSPSITLRASSQVRSPFLAGLTHPAIFLPMSYAQDFTDEELRIVLAHEVAHWRHRDNLWVAFAQVSCAALWMQPLLWVLVRRMAQAAEENCDIAAVAMGCSAWSYAECLLSLAERLLPTRMERSFGNGVAPYRSSLGQRIQTILNAPRQSPLPRWSRVVIALSVALGMVLGLRLVSGADASGTAVDVVQQYIADCSAGRLTQAYDLLSPNTRNYISYEDFANQSTSYDFVRPYPPLFAITSLFQQPHNVANIRFEVIGPDPQRPNSVLVCAYQPGAKEGNSVTISIVTVANPKTGSPQLDIIQTSKPLIPNIVQKLEARKLQKECALHLKQIGQALIQYETNHHYHFPHADHWVDEIMPYVKDSSIFHDPAGPVSQKYSYAFNRNLSGLSLERVDSPAETVAVFDSTKGVKNASDTGQSLPRPGRHTNGGDFGFTDGHTKWIGDREQYQLSFAPSSSSHRSASPTKTAPIQATEGSSRQGLRTRQTQTDTEARLAIVTQDNVPIHSKATKDSRILSIIPGGQSLAIESQTESYYQVLMIDHSFGYIAQDAVQLLNYEVMHTPAPTLGQQMVRLADSYLGTPYIRHSHMHTGIDDSGLVKAIYASAKIPLPQSDFAQSGVGYDVPHNVATGDWRQWVPGDRMYFAFRHPRIDHTGMYIGKGLFIHTSVGHSNQVAIDHVNSPYYAKHLVAVRRSQELLGEPAS